MLKEKHPGDEHKGTELNQNKEEVEGRSKEEEGGRGRRKRKEEEEGGRGRRKRKEEE